MHISQEHQDARRSATSAVMDQSLALVRLLSTLRAQKQDRSAHLLLFSVGRCGPLRQSALAELSHIDSSTISRHVADLVAQGLVVRQPDPADGRASLLALTSDGSAALASMRRERDERASEALSGWATAELIAFTVSLTRYTHDLEKLLAAPTTAAAPRAGAATPQEGA